MKIFAPEYKTFFYNNYVNMSSPDIQMFYIKMLGTTLQTNPHMIVNQETTFPIHINNPSLCLPNHHQ